MSLLFRSGRRYFVRHAGQGLLAMFGIGLGVAVVVALDLVSASANESFARATQFVLGRATHRVVGGTAGIEAADYATLRVNRGWRRMAPVVEGVATLRRDDSADGVRRAVTVLGVDVFAEAPLRQHLAFGAGPRSLDIASLVAEPETGILEAGTASTLGIAPGDRVDLVVSGRGWSGRIVDTLEVADPLVREGMRGVVVTDIATAQELFGRGDRIDRIDVRLEPEEVARFRAALPAGLRLETVASRRGALAEITRAFRTNLRALGYLALLVGAFLIYNTMAFAVVQRRKHFGIARALGATRGQVLRAVMGEALWIGGCGVALGLGLGVLLAHLLLAPVGQALNDHYASVSVATVRLDPGVLAGAATLGMLTCLLAAFLPALEAVSAAPGSALQRTALEGRVRRGIRRLGLGSLILGAIGALTLWWSERSLTGSWLGLLAVTLATAMMTPVAAGGLLRLLRPLARRFGGAPGGLAASGALAALSRTAVAITALMLAVAATVGLAAMIQSFRTTVTRWLGHTLRADVYVSVRAPNSQHAMTTILADVVERLRSTEGVREVATYRWSTRASDLGEIRMVGFAGGPELLAGFRVLAGGEEAALQKFRAGTGVLISEPFAWRHRLAPDAEFVLQTDRGPHRVQVAGVFQDYASERGHVMLDRALYDRLFDDPGVTSMSLLATTGTGVDGLVTRLEQRVGGAQALFIRSNRALVETSLGIFDRTFAITDVLRLLCMVVAFFGVLSALMALQLERRREVGVLRAIGATPRQVRTLLLTQTGMLGLCAGLLALPVGAMLAWLMVDVINRRSFGWTILDLELSPWVMVQAVGMALVASLLAAVYPAWRMARQWPAEALREE